MTKYPVGATWVARNERGRIGKIWLEKRDQYYEMWWWSVDGSGYKSDWGTSYRKCKEEIPLYNSSGKPVRMKRVGQ